MKDRLKQDKRSAKILSAVDKALERYLSEPCVNAKTIRKAMKYSVFSGGKRIRPLLVVEAALACGASMSSALPVACAIELVHTYSLIHDDLPSMDDDDYRRGRPSCHKMFSEAVAILAGDALLTLAFYVIAEDVQDKTCKAAVKKLASAIGIDGMVGGQALDIELKDKHRDVNKIEIVNELKTAKLFEAATEMGAIVAGCNKRQIKVMSEYGSSLGKAFQIVDDILDNDGYAKRCGIKNATAKAHAMIKKAKDVLRIFDKNGKQLKGIADSVLERIN